MISTINYKDILYESFHADYILRHEKIFYEIAQINNELLLLEKFMNIELTLKELWLFDELIILAIIHRSMFAHLALKFVRIALDKNTDSYTLLNFKKDVHLNIIKNEHKNIINNQLKGKLNNKNLTARMIKARNEFLAHKNTELTTTNHESDDYFSFEELKTYIIEMNDFFNAITFDISNTYTESIYAKNIRDSSISMFEQSIDNILRKAFNSSTEIANGKYTGVTPLSSSTENLLREFEVLK